MTQPSGVKEVATMTYTITNNPTYNSTEITFDGKPCEAVRNALKALKFRWHSVKRCWYGYASEEAVAGAITAAADSDNEAAVVLGDGYMGGGSIYGSKSHKYLHGSELSSAIRADLQAAGIKGVTVRCKTYAGGQSITATVKVDSDGYADRAAFIAGWKFPCSSWGYAPELGSIHGERFYSMDDAAEQEHIRQTVAAYEYDTKATTRQSINHYFQADVAYLTESTRRKLRRINEIIAAYRYDNSNGMVDYFDTNFYYDIEVVPA